MDYIDIIYDIDKDESYLIKDRYALPAADLPEAINTALAQAKESGEFDGPQGPAGNDYVLTEADKQEIAELAADLVPSGGGGGSSEWKLLKTINTEEDVANIYFDFDSPVKEIMVKCRPVSDDTNKTVTFFKNATVGYGSVLMTFSDILGASTADDCFIAVLKHYPEFVEGFVNYNLYNTGIANNRKEMTTAYLDPTIMTEHNTYGDSFTCFNMGCWKGGTAGLFKIGTYVEVWAR